MSEAAITTLADEIEQLVARDRELVDSDALVSDLRDLTSGVKDLALAVDRALHVRSLMREAGHAVPPLPANFATLADQLDSILSADTLDHQSAQQLVTRERPVIRRYVDRIQADIAQLYSQIIRSAMDALPPPEALAVLRETDPARASRMSEIQDRLTQLAQRAPRSVEECRMPSVWAAELRDLLADAGDIPKAVLEFYARIGKGVPLSDLGSDVFDWLAKRGRLQAYLVYPATADISRGGR